MVRNKTTKINSHHHSHSIAEKQFHLWRWKKCARLVVVMDHVKGIDLAFQNGRAGETYNIGAATSAIIIRLLKLFAPSSINSSQERMENFMWVNHLRPRSCRHDKRYAIDATKIETELNWKLTKTSTAAFRKQWSGIWRSSILDSRFWFWQSRTQQPESNLDSRPIIFIFSAAFSPINSINSSSKPLDFF